MGGVECYGMTDKIYVILKMMSTPVHMRELCLRFELLYL
jgi:hypothetical protein